MASPSALDDMFGFISASPSPRHAVVESCRRLRDAGFQSSSAGSLPARGFRARGGSLLAWINAAKPGPVRVVTAHTDSPNLRIKPNPDSTSTGLRQFGVEVYGGALLNSWLDRDLGISGHVVVRHDAQIETRLLRIDRPVLRVPQLAIHLDRDISTKGLLLNRQQNLRPIWGIENDSDEGLADLLAAELDLDAGAILAYELMAHDTLSPARWGWHDEFFASPRIDNQLSCWAAVEALIGADTETPCVVALFDHEEVGSTSATGADSGLLLNLLAELTVDGADHDRSLCISADCAHATHPNYVDRHDAEHQIALNGGPVIKVNANERYATTPLGHALFAEACTAVGSQHQIFVSRTDLACGSTVGPITAARTGLETVDVGIAQLAMHSARESAGAEDPARLLQVLTHLFCP